MIRWWEGEGENRISWTEIWRHKTAAFFKCLLLTAIKFSVAMLCNRICVHQHHLLFLHGDCIFICAAKQFPSKNRCYLETVIGGGQRSRVRSYVYLLVAQMSHAIVTPNEYIQLFTALFPHSQYTHFSNDFLLPRVSNCIECV